MKARFDERIEKPVRVVILLAPANPHPMRKQPMAARLVVRLQADGKNQSTAA